MKLHEFVGRHYGCNFPASLTELAVQYYLENSAGKRAGFVMNMMLELNDFTLHRDEARYMREEAPEALPELLEAYLFAAYRHVKEKGRKPRGLHVDFVGAAEEKEEERPFARLYRENGGSPAQ